MKKQLAFDYLIKEIYSIPTSYEREVDKIVENAKKIKMEETESERIYSEEEFKKAVIDACKNFGNLNGVDIEDYEEYYNETYKK